MWVYVAPKFHHALYFGCTFSSHIKTVGFRRPKQTLGIAELASYRMRIGDFFGFRKIYRVGIVLE